MDTGENFDPRIEYAIHLRNNLEKANNFINNNSDTIIPTTKLSALENYVEESNDYLTLNSKLNKFISELNDNIFVLNIIRSEGKNRTNNPFVGFPTVKGTRELISKYSEIFNPNPNMLLECLYDKNIESIFETIDYKSTEINESKDISQIQKSMEYLESAVTLMKNNIFLNITDFDGFNEYVGKIHSFKNTHSYVAFNKWNPLTGSKVKGYKNDWLNYKKEGWISKPFSKVVRKFANTLPFPTPF